MKYLITGSDGQLAKEFIRVLPPDSTYHFTRLKLDITKESELKEAIDYIKPDIFINCAAYNNVDKAESEFDKALATNATSLKKIALFCEKYKTLIIHFSSDYVFSGEKTLPYTESDDPNPINKYGVTKLEGEKNLILNYERYIIFRVSWVYGDGVNNFINRFLTWAKGKEKIYVSIDEVSVPTSTVFIVNNTLKSMKDGLTGLWHLVPLGYTTRYDWALKISQILNLKIEIEKTTQDYFNLPAKRPKFSAMSSESICRELSLNFDYWERYFYEFMKQRGSI